MKRPLDSLARSLLVGSALAACGGAVSGGIPGGDGGTGDGGGTACATNADCAKTSYCDRGGTCGTGGTRGTCKALPQGCADLYSPACGCDGKTYGNSCDAAGHGVDLDASGKCTPPPGWLFCGDKACTADFSYCQRTPNDARAPGEPAEYTSCQQLPMVCAGKSDCACFPTSTPCIQFNQCKAIDVGSGKTGFQITCPGG
jgi:hypothetical protein